MIRILFLFIVSLLLLSCEKPRDIIDRDQTFCLLNESGVQIAIVPKSDYSHIPDSLILQNGEKYIWGLFVGPFLLNNDSDQINVYFDEIFPVYYTGRKDHGFRDPRNEYFYEYKEFDDGCNALTFTFTEEDYQRALELNKPTE